ncbi:hypothetical protein BCR43DRAFT_126181 [Syncephalastrum racemosum]|uniref:GATA-type domain-containing protein n=1 Tax=Syncephalastrum racemosum TaxID=13706 RepID=A0A1X2HKU7_SYNRA|nr:hypothetical protein BCR43DRAFT_126181 [Syncephalastrum racemosum]
MTRRPNCFWSLLTVDRLEFAYMSPAVPRDMSNAIVGRSILDILHPAEVTLARNDFYHFAQAKGLGGSITRCRLRNMTEYWESTPHQQHQEPWLVVDIAMYVVTDDLLLAFFHEAGSSSACGEDAFNDEHAAIARVALHGLDAYSDSSPRPGPRRVLHITDSRTKSVLLSWPERYHHDVPFEDPLMTPSEEPNCCHCTRQATPTLVTSTLSFSSGERLVLSYGDITFSLIHARSEPAMQPQQIRSPSLLHMQSDPKIFTRPTSPSWRSHLRKSPTDTERRSSYFDTEPLAKKSRPAADSNEPAEGGFIPYARRNHVDPTTPPTYLSSRRSASTPTALQTAGSHASLPADTRRRHSSFAARSDYAPIPQHSPHPPHPHAPTTPNASAPPPSAQAMTHKYCESCGTGSSPEWRRGPSGHKT